MLHGAPTAVPFFWGSVAMDTTTNIHINSHSHIFLLTQQTAGQQQDRSVWSPARQAPLSAQFQQQSHIPNDWVYFWYLKSAVLLTEMPIASGAAGRVDVGAGLHTGTTWTTDGQRMNTKFTNRDCDSYLLRWVDYCSSVLRCKIKQMKAHSVLHSTENILFQNILQVCWCMKYIWRTHVFFNW